MVYGIMTYMYSGFYVMIFFAFDEYQAMIQLPEYEVVSQDLL